MSQQIGQKNFGITLIAGICALGMGLLAAATVMSTPPGLILFLASLFVVNYTLPLFYSQLARRLIAADREEIERSKKSYLESVLRSQKRLDEINSFHARNIGLTRAFWTGLASLFLSGLAGALVYGVASMIPAAFVSIGVAVLMCASMAIVSFLNYNGSMKEVWNGIRGENSDFKSQSSFVKYLVTPIFVLSCVAAGLLVAGITFEGVLTTMGALSPLASMAIPVAWACFGCMALATFAMTAYGYVNLFDKNKWAEKKDMFNSFFKSSQEYQNDLQTQWESVCTQIKEAEVMLSSTDPISSLEGNKKLQHKLNELYRQKDSIYHRHTVYRQPWFNALYKGITFVVFGICMAGTLMHLARGYQGLESGLFVKGIALSQGLARGIATGVMYASLLAETLFTGVIVTSTMNEEAMLGKQTRQYEDHLDKQQTPSDKAHDYFFQTSRGMHFMFEGLLGLFGADGHGAEHEHGAKTGIPFADNPKTQQFMGVSMGVAAGFERHEGENSLLTFRYNSKGEIDDIEDLPTLRTLSKNTA